MTRPPHARSAVLAAAEALVREIGAANLTYDELVRRSGITRGGITYHFPTKDALIAAIVDNDLQQWRECVQQKRESLSGRMADLKAYVMSSSEPDEQTNRLCAGLLSVAAGSSTLNEPWKNYYANHHREVTRRSPDPVAAAIVTLATEGLFWQETLGLSPLNGRERQQVVKRLLALADAMDPETHDANDSQTS